MGDENWTVVARRRASKTRHRRTSSISFANADPRHADECDEAPLLLKMKRSMTRVEESAFFKKFLDQVQSPAVLNRLCRAASESGFEAVFDDDSDDDVDDDKKLRDGMLECESMFDCLSIFGCASAAMVRPCEITSLSAARVSPCESTLNDLESSTSSSTSPFASKLQPCESAHNDLERSTSASAFPCASQAQTCGGACADSLCNVSKGMAGTVGGRNCCNVECESLAKVCCSRYSGAVVCICRNAAPMVTECCAEAEKELTSINGIEGCEDSITKQRPGCQVSQKHWRLRVVLYGLGSIAYSEVSRYQLALILLLKQRFSWVGEIEVYDPILSKIECKLIEGMGCVPIAVDENGRRSVSEPTLFYMPHCEEWLYDHVLQANWVPHTLGQLVILGNSFQSYLDQWSSAIRQKTRPFTHVIQYQQLAREIPLKVSSSDLPGFNDLSWHFYEPREEDNITLKSSIAS